MAIDSIAAVPPSPDAHRGHENNNAAKTSENGPSFSSMLSQAISQGHAGGGHGGSTGGNIGHGGHGVSNMTGTHPNHIGSGGADHGGGHDFQEKALGVRVYRQQLLASNIANADTPNYKAVDIDVQEALRAAASGASSMQLAATAPGHVSGQATSPPYPLKYRIPTQPSIDGNTVDMNIEQAAFSENALMYEFTLDRVGGHFKHMMELLRDLK